MLIRLHFVVIFISFLGSFIFPFTFILVVDWFTCKRYVEPIETFYKTPNSFEGWFSWPAPWAIFVLIVGVVITQMELLIPLVEYAWLPWKVCVAVIAAAIYFFGLKLFQAVKQ